MSDITNGGLTLFSGSYINAHDPWWASANIPSGGAANIVVSTLTVNSIPAGNILLTSQTSNQVEYNAPLVFQRPIGDVNGISESLVMNTSHAVPSLPIDGEFITATTALGTAYDDIAVRGLQIFGAQTTSGNSGCAAYITGNSDNKSITIETGGVYISSLFVSTLAAETVVSTTTGVANSYTASIFMSTPILYTNTLSTTGSVFGKDAYFDTASISSANISSVNIGSFSASEIDANTISSLSQRTLLALTSTLQLKADITVSPNVNLGLGNVIQGLIGGAATQALGVIVGTTGLVTGAAALITGRTAGGANPSVFQTINGSTQLQFSTIGSPALNIFLDTDSTDPLHTPGNLTSTSRLVAAGTYCVRSVGDPLNVDSATQGIQMFGQWVPVIQPSATFPAINASTINTSNFIASQAAISTLSVSTIQIGTQSLPSTLSASSINMVGQFQGLNPLALFSWVGETHIPNAVTSRLRFWDNFNTLEGEIYATTQPNTGLTLVAPNGMRIQNAETPLIPNIGFNSNATVDIYSTLRVQSLQNYGTAYISSLYVSTLNGSIQQLIPSTLNVSSIAAVGSITAPYAYISTLYVSTLNGGAGPPLAIPSTINASTISVNGRFTTPDVFLLDSETYLSTGYIVGGKRTNGTNGVNIFSGVDGNISLHAGAVGTPGITFTYQNSLLPPTESLFGAFEPQGGGPEGTDPQLLLNCELRSPYNNIFGESLTSFTTQFLETDTDSKVGFMTGGRRGAGTQGLNIFSGEGGTITIADQLAPNGQNPLNTIASFQYQTTFPQGAQTTINGQVNFTNQIEVLSTTITKELFVRDRIDTFNIVTTELSAYSGFINNISTTNIKAIGTAAINNLSTTNILATDVSTITLNSQETITTASLFVPTISSVTTINGAPYPPPSIVPIGIVLIWAGGNSSSVAAPPGWTICNGAGLPTEGLYNDLFKVIGHTYDNPAYPYSDNTFFLPDLTFAVPMGAPTTPGYQQRVSVYSVASFSGLTANPNQIWYMNTTQTDNKPVVINTQFSTGTYTLYVSAILSGGGQDGYYLMQNVDNTTIYPVVGVSDPPAPIVITATGYYNPGALPYRRQAYEVGSYNDDGGANTRVSHNQTQLEVGPHTHLGVPDKASSAIVGTGYSVGNGGSTGWPQESYINTRLPAGDTANHQNYGTKTAPNFLNMFYIIRYA